MTILNTDSKPESRSGRFLALMTSHLVMSAEIGLQMAEAHRAGKALEALFLEEEFMITVDLMETYRRLFLNEMSRQELEHFGD